MKNHSWSKKRAELAFLVLAIPLHGVAAEATVEICVTVTATTSPVEDAISGLEDSCFTVNRSLLEEDDFPYPARRVISDSDTREYLYGACNTSGASLNYTIETNWHYSIETEALGFGEFANGWVSRQGVPGRLTAESGSFGITQDGTMSDGVCVDFRSVFTAGVEVGVGADPFILSRPEGLNGLFFDPENPGHGFDLNVIEEGGLVVYYYGHTADGERLWLISEVYSEPLLFHSQMELEMFEVTGGTFGNPQLPETSWGTLNLNMHECDSGSATLSGDDGELQVSLTRLGGVFGVGCQ